MKNIMLCCSAGMSTSLLVTKMQNYCKEKGLDYNIWAIGANKVSSEFTKADIILLGPQIRYMKDEVERLVKDKNIPVEVIDLRDYGTMRGDHVIEFVNKILNKGENEK